MSGPIACLLGGDGIRAAADLLCDWKKRPDPCPNRECGPALAPMHRAEGISAWLRRPLGGLLTSRDTDHRPPWFLILPNARTPGLCVGSLTSPTRTGPTPARGPFSGGSGEAHLPAQQHQAEAVPRLPCPYGHQRRPQRPQASSRQGSQAPCAHRAHEELLSPTSSRQASVQMSATPTRDGFTLPRSSRLRRTSDYRRVQGRGRKVRRRSLLVLWLPRRDHPIPRVGLTVSKKVGNAVVRNQVKRWLREAVRHELHRLVRPVDVVLIAHPNAATSSASSLRDEVRSAFREVMGETPPRRSRRHRTRRSNPPRKPDRS